MGIVMVYLLFVLNIAAVFCAVGLIQQKVYILRLCAVTWVTFFAEYIVCSGLAFWMDLFEINGVLGVLCAVNLVICGLLMIKKKSHFAVDFAYKKYAALLVIAVCGLPFIFSKFEFFGMGQDEGIYQTQAISLIYGYTDVQQDFEEYDTLDSDEEKSYFSEKLESELVGLYRYDTSLPLASGEQQKSDVSAIYHGIPTFAAILALWGKLFGIDHMSDVQTLFYLCALIFAWSIFETMGCKKTVCAVCTGLLAFSPLIIWVSKSALTEIGLTCFAAAFIWGLVQENKKTVIWSAVPVAAFSFYHITIYTMIPVILLVYGLYFVYTGKKSYMAAAFISLTAFLTGIWMTASIAGTYAFVYNFQPLYNLLPFVNSGNIMYTISIVCAFAYACMLVLYFVPSVSKWIKRILRWVKTPAFYICVVVIIICQVKIVIENRELFQGMKNASLHTTLVGYVICVGIIVPAMAAVLSLFWIRRFWSSIRNGIILVLFLYCIGLYSCMMHPYVQYYYYYGRYLAPYLLVVLLFSAVMLNQLDVRIAAAGGIASLAVLLPASALWLDQKDDSRMTWDTLAEAAQIMDEGDIAVIEPEDMKYYYLTLRAISGVRAYPAEEDYEAQMQRLAEKTSGNVYYIRNGQSVENDRLEIVYTSQYTASEDNNIYDMSFLPFPDGLTVTKVTVTCKKLNKPKTDYDFIGSRDDIVVSGVELSEGTFSWTSDTQVELLCELEKKDYEMHIVLGGEIPLEALHIDSYPVGVYMNDNYVGEVAIDTDNDKRGDYKLRISKDDIVQGSNRLRLEMDLWSPRDYGAEDERKLGIPLQRIEFKELSDELSDRDEEEEVKDETDYSNSVLQ